MAGKFKMDRAGVRTLLNSAEVAAMSLAAAERVAGAARVNVPDGVPVSVRPVRTDRACAAVSVESPRGLSLQAKHGTLTRAAAAVGLTVKPR